jgi:hypothetical protein
LGVSEQKAGAEPVRTKVSRSEELLWEHYAPLVRRLGRMAEEGEAARGELEALLASCREADQLAAGQGMTFEDFDAEGRSPETRFLEDVYERLWPVVGQAYDAHREVSALALNRVIQRRSLIDSQPATEGAPRWESLQSVADVQWGQPMPPALLTLDALRKLAASLTKGCHGTVYTNTDALRFTARNLAAQYDLPFEVMPFDHDGPAWMAVPPAGAGG